MSTTNRVLATHDTHEQTEHAAKELEEDEVNARSLSIAGRDAHSDEHGAGYFKVPVGPDHSIPEAVAVLNFRHECRARWGGAWPMPGR